MDLMIRIQPAPLAGVFFTVMVTQDVGAVAVKVWTAVRATVGKTRRARRTMTEMARMVTQYGADP